MSAIEVRQLSCGMPLIVEPMSGVRSVGVSWLIPAGSSTDPEDKQGLCSILTEMLMRGAGDLDSRAQADALDRVGVARSCEPTTHHIRLGFALTWDRLGDALGLMTDMVRRPRLEESSVEPARQLALQALESLADDPQQRAMIACKARHAEAPYNRSGMGTEEGLGRVTRADVVAHWGARARPVGSVLAIAGAVGGMGGGMSVDEIAVRLDRLLGDWSGGADAPGADGGALKGTFHHEMDDSAQVQIVLMHDAPAEKSEDAALERVVSGVLSGGMSCRLFTEVREKRGLCYSVSQGYAADKDWGRCVAYVGTTPERAQQSLEVLCAELDRIEGAEGAVTAEEFERAVIGIRSSIVMSGESTGARAGALAMDQFKLGRARTLEEVEARYARMTLGEVNGYLSRRVSVPRTIVTLGPSALSGASASSAG
ncbi:MAG: insulinase family protein [Phycisphaeraceae bacterium]|nr:insulinase family protein [Phycisphaeraceae bacterium]